MIDNYRIKEIAEKVVLQYFQSWGQTLDERIKALNMAVAAADIKAVFTQTDAQAGWIGTEGEIASQFRKELDKSWPIGSFEEERDAVITIINSYRSRKR